MTGLLCRARDAGDLAEKMERMLSLPEAERCALGARGRLKMEREYDERLVIRVYLDALREARTRTDAVRVAPVERRVGRVPPIVVGCTSKIMETSVR